MFFITRTWISICCNEFKLSVSYALGLLTSEEDVASQASVILKDLISSYIDTDNLLTEKSLSSEDEGNLAGGDNINAARSVCTVFESTLNSCDGIPKEHILTVTGLLIEKLGRCTFTRVLCFIILNILATEQYVTSKHFTFKKS